MRLGKKGDAEFPFELIVIFGVYISYFTLLSSLILFTLSDLAETHNLEQYLHQSRLAYGEGGVWYEDEVTGQLYPGIVDEQKLDAKVIADLFSEEKEIGIKIVLGSISVVWLNKELYEQAEHVYRNEDSYFHGSIFKHPVVTKGGNSGVLTTGVMFIS